jgi:hypothetical protein
LITDLDCFRTRRRRAAGEGEDDGVLRPRIIGSVLCEIGKEEGIK